MLFASNFTEKEMLSEARARLANTQGKKAKRKARERQLEEARRLAMLQKKRELKAAGIMYVFPSLSLSHLPSNANHNPSIRPKKKKGEMDYQADIPFEKQPAPGFYDTAEETARSYSAPVGKTLKQLDQAGTIKRSRPEDSQDSVSKRQKKSQEKAETVFVAAKDQQIKALKQQNQISRRGKLVLPEPQVGDVEMEEIVKIGRGGEEARGMVLKEGEEGDSMLGDYTPLEKGTPRTMRTEKKRKRFLTHSKRDRF
jgi:pre-mRNA-splicing factor CDC5/CEF1